MGNCIRERKENLLFDVQEMSKLNSTFDYYCDLNPITRRKRQLSEKSFEEIFVENPEFGRKMFKLLERYGEQEKYIRRGIVFQILEVLLKDSCSNNEMKNFEKLELMTLISLQQTAFIREKEELHSLKITYLDAMTIVNDILRIRISGEDNCIITDETATKALLDTLFTNEPLIDWYELIRVLKKHINSSIVKCYFQHKFMRKPLPTLVPQLSTNSYLINDDQLLLLQMNASKTILQGSHQLELIYSNVVHQGGFTQMINLLTASQSPTLMLFEHQEEYTQLYDRSKMIKSHIFGAISNQRWFDTAVAQGDNNDILFQIFPKFQVYRAKDDSAKAFCYLNTLNLNKPVGIGFGYESEEKSRIWIDEILSRSYCMNEDSTYQPGDLIHKHIKQLKISTIEIWAIKHPAKEQEVEFMQQAANQPFNELDLLNGLDSKADYYWVKKEPVIEEPQGPFYWQNSKATTQQVTNPLPIYQKPSYSQVNNQSEITTKLNGNNSYQPYQPFEETKVISTIQTTSVRRSNITRPVLDFKEQNKPIEPVIPQQVRSTYEPQAVNTLQDTYVRRTFNQQETKLSSTAQPRQRKTVDEIIRNYEERQKTKLN